VLFEPCVEGACSKPNRMRIKKKSSLWSLYYRHPLWLVNKSSFPPLLCTHPLLLVMTWWACMFSGHFLLYTSTSCLLKNFNSQVWKSTYRICCCWKPWPWANFFSSAWSIRTSSRLDVFHFRSHIRSAVWKATLSVPSLFSCLLVSRHCLARLKKFLPSCVVHITTSGEHAYTFPRWKVPIRYYGSESVSVPARNKFL
jgi:hypothetical protein